MTRYVNITHTEMDEYLLPQGFKEVRWDTARERVYAKEVGQDLHIIVFSGIVGTMSRDRGQDAIRVGVWLFSGDERKTCVSGDKRVHRVEGWRKNLQNRLDRWKEAMWPPCPRCAAPMVERQNRQRTPPKPFLGCARYPECRGTREVA